MRELHGRQEQQESSFTGFGHSGLQRGFRGRAEGATVTAIAAKANPTGCQKF
jgi:hypothetical protein